MYPCYVWRTRLGLTRAIRSNWSRQQPHPTWLNPINRSTFPFFYSPTELHLDFPITCYLYSLALYFIQLCLPDCQQHV